MDQILNPYRVLVIGENARPGDDRILQLLQNEDNGIDRVFIIDASNPGENLSPRIGMVLDRRDTQTLRHRDARTDEQIEGPEREQISLCNSVLRAVTSDWRDGEQRISVRLKSGGSDAVFNADHHVEGDDHRVRFYLRSRTVAVFHVGEIAGWSGTPSG